MNIGEILVSALTGPLAKVGQAKLVEVFNAMYAKNPATYRTALTALYPIIDVQVETITDASKNKIDDAFVAAIKGAIEESAKVNGLELPNLDND